MARADLAAVCRYFGTGLKVHGEQGKGLCAGILLAWNPSPWKLTVEEQKAGKLPFYEHWLFGDSVGC